MSFTAPAPSPPVTSPVSPASPSRPGRLRGLSYRYLRHYTNNHHQHSRDPSNASATSVQPSALTRATSHPTTAPNPPANRQTATDNLAGRQLASRAIPAEPRPTADQPNSESDTGGPTSGWLPTVGGQSVASRIATEPQPTATGISSALLSASNSGAEDGAFATVVGRSRSSTTGPTMGLDTVPVIAAHPQLGDPQLQYGSMPSHIGHSSSSSAQLPSIRFSQHQDIRAPRPSLVFSPMSRTLPTGKEIIRVGRYSEREAQPSLNSTSPSAAPVGFKSKVVSRRHCEFWLQDAVWYIKDVKSSSGTFLNHVRLSSPGTESKPFPVKDGDIVQLGIDFKGGEEMIFRCVKIRIELNRGWQSSLNSFNVASHKALRNMARQALNTGTTSSQDCSICLGAIAPCQSLFVAPCSHTWHYKCVRRIINGPMWPQFICPNCRAVADLEAEVDDPYADGEWEEVEAIDTLEDVHASGIQETLSRGVDAAIDEGLTSQDDIEPADVQNSLEEAHVHPSSEDSESDMHETTTNMDNLDLSAADQPHSSHSSSAPVDIPSGRNSVTRSATEPGDPRSEQTPSPSGRTPAHLVDSLRGPMTPTNDAGPFVFDGSAGRASRARMSTLSAVADSESQDS